MNIFCGTCRCSRGAASRRISGQVIARSVRVSIGDRPVLVHRCKPLAGMKQDGLQMRCHAWQRHFLPPSFFSLTLGMLALDIYPIG
ncbi:hypothetical protein EMIT0158MI4_40121 [Burkholderia ambifaria]